MRFTPAELEEVTTRARICGRPVACYIREVSLGRRPRRTNAIMSSSVIRELAGVATGLRGLGLVAAERDLPEAAEFDATLEEVLQFIRRVVVCARPLASATDGLANAALRWLH